MAVDTACAITSAMKDDNPKKFSMRTPKHQEKRPRGGYRTRKKDTDPKRIDQPDAKEGQLLKMQLSILICEGATKAAQEKVKCEGGLKL